MTTRIQICLLLLLFAVQPLLAQNIELVKDGVAKAEIILPEKPNSIEAFAARELAEHIRLVSGAECRILHAPSNTALPIRLGRAAKLNIKNLKKNSASIRISSDGIDIAGVDGTGQAQDLYTAGGTLFGVYDFLQKRLGIRWLWPGDLGRTYSQSKDIVLPASEWEIHPLVFSCWRVSLRGKERWTNEANYQRFQDEQRLWMRRHRFALADTLNRGHAWTAWYNRFHKEHPDWFNLLPNGQREPDPLWYGGRKDLISMCVTNPGFVQKVIEDWRKRGIHDIINANENDTAGKCTCPECLASDGIGNDQARLAEARKRMNKYDPQWWEALGSLSDRYCRLYLKLLEEGRKYNPEARVMGGTYANHNDPPRYTKLNPSIILRMTPPVMYPWTPEKVKAYKDNWKGWADTGASLMFRPNFTLDGHNFPLMYYRYFAECYDFAVKNNLCAVDLDSYMGMSAANGITNYVIATKINEPERSLEELEADYCGAFGKAGSVMRKYIANFESATAKGFQEGPRHKRIEGGNYAEFIVDAPKVFTDEVMAKAFSLLKEAETVEDNPVVRKRLDFIKTGLMDCQHVLNTQKGFDEYRKSGNAIPFAKAYKQLLEYRNAHEGVLYQNRSYVEGFEQRLWPRHLLSLLNKNETEILNWKIRFDPENKGQAEKWQLGKAGAEWEPVTLDTHWKNKPIGQKWKKEHAQKEYNGIGWYKTGFTAKNINPNEKLELIFWAVDGLPVIYLNGEIILDKHPIEDPARAWLTPFNVDITGKLKEGENILAVRLDKEAEGPRGIIKSVFLKRGESPAEKQPPQTPPWKASFQFGAFRKPTSYHVPLTLTALKSDPSKPQYNGVWGRFYQVFPLKTGQTYEVKTTFKTSPGFKGNIEIWLRPVGNGKKDKNTVQSFRFLSTEGKEQTCTFRFNAVNDACSIYLNLTKAPGIVTFTQFSLEPIQTIQQ